MSGVLDKSTSVRTLVIRTHVAGGGRFHPPSLLIFKILEKLKILLSKHFLLLCPNFFIFMEIFMHFLTRFCTPSSSTTPPFYNLIFFSSLPPPSPHPLQLATNVSIREMVKCKFVSLAVREIAKKILKPRK